MREVCDCLLERRKQLVFVYVIFVQQIKQENNRQILVSVNLGVLLILYFCPSRLLIMT